MFRIVLALHVTAALTAVVSGALSAAATKGPAAIRARAPSTCTRSRRFSSP